MTFHGRRSIGKVYPGVDTPISVATASLSVYLCISVSVYVSVLKRENELSYINAEIEKNDHSAWQILISGVGLHVHAAASFLVLSRATAHDRSKAYIQQTASITDRNSRLAHYSVQFWDLGLLLGVFSYFRFKI